MINQMFWSAIKGLRLFHFGIKHTWEQFPQDLLPNYTQTSSSINILLPLNSAELCDPISHHLRNNFTSGCRGDNAGGSVLGVVDEHVAEGEHHRLR